jgi:hypothetical protein
MAPSAPVASCARSHKAIDLLWERLQVATGIRKDHKTTNLLWERLKPARTARPVGVELTRVEGP